MTHQLNGVALIAGAGSGGIGAACAKAFALAGCRHIVLIDIDAAGLDDTVKEITAKVDSSRVTAHVLDVVNDEAVEKLVAEIPEKYGSLDYAVNCAGVSTGLGKIHEVEMKEIDRVLNINLRAQIVLCRAEVKAMLASKAPEDKQKGAIINMSSVYGVIAATGDHTSYVISKQAMIALTKSMATAYGSEGIRTNALAPGLIDTKMTMPMPDVVRGHYIGRTPMDRAGQSEEVAETALFLCSPAASYINGATVPIDGGLLAR